MKPTRIFSSFLVLITIVAIPTGAIAADKDGFTSLFDGKTLNGWVKKGGQATYRVEDGDVIGTVGPGRNTFLCTEKSYCDFMLKLEMKYDEFGNSGVQFRSHQKVRGKRDVFGYQCEVDPTERAWSGGIYDEKRRGWLYTLEGKDEARKSYKLNQWNKIVIKAVGPHIQTWINGIKCADLIDTADLEGFIGLQVHAGETGIIRWRNIRLKDLGVSKWESLFNGKDLAGWETSGSGSWAVEDGIIRGKAVRTGKRGDDLITEKRYNNFAIRLKYKIEKGGSGVYFRAENIGKCDVSGLLSTINGTLDGGLCELGGRGWLLKPEVGKVRIPRRIKSHTWCESGVWNDMSIVAIGPRIVIIVNGIQIADIVDPDASTDGYIGLKLNHMSEEDVRFKNIEILEISPERE